MTTSRTRLIVLSSSLAVILCLTVAPVRAAELYWLSYLEVTTTYGDDYITAPEITDGTMDLFSFGFGASSLDVDLGAYAATGVTLADLVGEINLGWQADVDGSQQVAYAYFDTGPNQWRLQLRDPDGDGTDFAVGGPNTILAFDELTDWQAMAVPEPMTLSLLAMGGAAVLTRRKK